MYTYRKSNPRSTSFMNRCKVCAALRRQESKRRCDSCLWNVFFRHRDLGVRTRGRRLRRWFCRANVAQSPQYAESGIYLGWSWSSASRKIHMVAIHLSSSWAPCEAGLPMDSSKVWRYQGAASLRILSWPASGGRARVDEEAEKLVARASYKCGVS